MQRGRVLQPCPAAPASSPAPAPTSWQRIDAGNLAYWTSQRVIKAELARVEANWPVGYEPVRVVGWMGEPVERLPHRPYWLAVPAWTEAQLAGSVSDPASARSRAGDPQPITRLRMPAGY